MLYTLTHSSAQAFPTERPMGVGPEKQGGQTSVRRGQVSSKLHLTYTLNVTCWTHNEDEWYKIFGWGGRGWGSVTCLVEQLTASTTQVDQF